MRQMARRYVPIRLFDNYLFIVGAQKAGTTSLHSFLAQHQSIVCASTKELGFFHRDKIYAEGLHFYRSHYPVFRSAKYALDSTPEYLYFRMAPERIHSFKPNAKIIILLREPVSRAFSAFNMYKQIVDHDWFRSRLRYSNSDSKSFFTPIANGLVDPNIDYFIDREMEIIHGNASGEEPALIRRGIYAPQIKRYVDLFGKENVLIIFSEDLRQQTKKILNQVFDAIELERLNSIELVPQHVREYTVDTDAKERIRERASYLFAHDKQELIDVYDLDVPW